MTHKEVEERNLKELDSINTARMAGLITQEEYESLMRQSNLRAQKDHIEIERGVLYGIQ